MNEEQLQMMKQHQEQVIPAVSQQHAELLLITPSWLHIDDETCQICVGAHGVKPDTCWLCSQ